MKKAFFGADGVLKAHGHKFARTVMAYAGAIRYNRSRELVDMQITGQVAYYHGKQNILSSGAASSQTTISLSSQIPANALTASINFYGRVFNSADNNGSTGSFRIRYITGIEWMEQYYAADGNTDTSYTGGGGNLCEIPNVSQQIFYLWTNVLGTGVAPIGFIDVLGYRLPIPS